MQRMKEGITKPAYARLRSTNRRFKKKDGSWGRRNTSVDLCFNAGAMKLCSLTRGDKVDVFYVRYDEDWERPILVVRKDGTQRKLTGTKKATNWLTIAIGCAVKQWDIPLIVGRHLDILDYIDGDILIDITDKNAELHVVREKKKKMERSRERLTAQMGYAVGKGNGYVFKTTQSLRDMMKIASKREDRPVNRIIIDALEKYLEENHDDLCR